MLPDNFKGTSSVLRGNLISAHIKSKYENHGKLVFYDSDTDPSKGGGQRNEVLTRIHHDALSECNGFFLVYQPIVRTDSGKITGAEALLRWSDDEYGLVSPNDFIPWLEDDPCFFKFGSNILLRALRDGKKLLEIMPEFTVNVNIAVQQLNHDGFREQVTNALREADFPPEHLCLELTERCRELNEDYLKDEIDFFRSNGIRIALDDIGTGFSSFSLLLNQNVDEVKIDHSFIKEIQDKKANQILTKMIIDAANSIGCSTCLEGVENENLRDYLNDYGATYYQGYYCDKPQPFDDFLVKAKEWNENK